ncbi:MAG: hypothetical protein K1X74_08850 [Pirellulales bacterium]|nr:hypothetical protein [Pirellulales bacterium]
MSRYTLPPISQLNARLARNNARVAKLLDLLPERVDALIAALEREDWREVQELSEYFARFGLTYDLPHLHRPAQALCEGLQRRQSNSFNLCRHVLHLIGAYGRLRSQATV